MKKITLLFLFGILLLSACLPGPGVVTITPAATLAQNATLTPLGAASPTNPPDLALTPLPELGALETPAPTETPAPQAPAAFVLPHYLLDTLINYNTKTIAVAQTIRYTNNTCGFDRSFS